MNSAGLASFFVITQRTNSFKPSVWFILLSYVLCCQERELVLKRIAEDRKLLQEKGQTSAVTETSPPSGQGQKLGGKIQTNVDNNCILMVRLWGSLTSDYVCLNYKQSDYRIVYVFRCRFGCRPVSQCGNASQLMPLCVALWSTSPDVTPPYRPFPCSRVSLGNALGRQSCLARCSLLASHLTLHCVFRPLLQRHLRIHRALQNRHQQDRMSRLHVLYRHIFISLSRRRQESRTFYPLHYPTSFGKRQWIMQECLELVTHYLGRLTSGVSLFIQVCLLCSRYPENSLQGYNVGGCWFLCEFPFHHLVFVLRKSLILLNI